MSVALLQTCSIIWTDKNWEIFLRFLHIPLKYFAVPHLSVGFDIAFMYYKTTLEISSRTSIYFQAVLTGYQIDNVLTIKMKDPPRITSSVGDTACEIIGTY